MKQFALLAIVFSCFGCGGPKQVLVSSSEFKRDALLVAHNQERGNRGFTFLEMNETLNRKSQVWAESMARAGRLSHSRLNFEGTNFRTMGENVGYGYQSEDSVVRGWMASSGHRGNILNPRFTKVGFGHAIRNGEHYWCVQFGGER